MYFTSPSYIPQLPFPPPDSIPIHEFLFGDNDKYGRYPIAASKPPFTCGLTGKSYSALEVRERIEFLARALASRLGWSVNDGQELSKIDSLTVSWATHRLSGVSNQISASYTTPELAQQLRRVNCKALFTCVPLLSIALEAAAAAGIPRKHVYLLELPARITKGMEIPADLKTADQLINEGSQIKPLERLVWSKGQGARQTAFLCSSSGTTGLPKNAKISHRNVISNVMQVAVHESIYKATEPELCLGVLPVSHNFGLVVVAHLSIYRGDGVVVLPRFDLHETLQVIQDFRLGRLWMVPPMVGAMLKAPTLVEKYDISHVNTVVVGASNLSKEVATQFTNLIPGCKLTQGYGLTETTVAVTFENPLDIMFGSCGHLFPGCEGRLIDDNGQDIEEYDHPGELLVRSPTIMLGYLDNEVETRAMLSEDGWLRTGDLVRFKKSPNGHDHLFLIDRIKELIKVRGMQVSPVELENYLLRNPIVADATVVPVPSESSGELPMAFIVKSSAYKGADDKILKDELNFYMNETFSQHKRLAGGIEFVDSLPKSAAGKTQRKILKEWAKASVEASKSRAAATVQVFEFDSDEDLDDE